jgi:hypothetical protein
MKALFFECLIIWSLFPGRRLIAGDFNGDGYFDILGWYRQGRRAGCFFLSPNDRKGNFDQAIELEMKDTLKWLPAQSALLAADIDGDKYSDLVLQLRLGPDEGKWLWYPNNRQGGFDRGKVIRVNGCDTSGWTTECPLVHFSKPG